MRDLIAHRVVVTPHPIECRAQLAVAGTILDCQAQLVGAVGERTRIARVLGRILAPGILVTRTVLVTRTAGNLAARIARQRVGVVFQVFGGVRQVTARRTSGESRQCQRRDYHCDGSCYNHDLLLSLLSQQAPASSRSCMVTMGKRHGPQSERSYSATGAGLF